VTTWLAVRQRAATSVPAQSSRLVAGATLARSVVQWTFPKPTWLRPTSCRQQGNTRHRQRSSSSLMVQLVPISPRAMACWRACRTNGHQIFPRLTRGTATGIGSDKGQAIVCVRRALVQVRLPSQRHVARRWGNGRGVAKARRRDNITFHCVLQLTWHCSTTLVNGGSRRHRGQLAYP
jgi:hypothetical protein